MLKRRAAFHSWLVFAGAVYWWFIGWFIVLWHRFIGFLIGAERYNRLEQLFTFSWHDTTRSGTVVFGFSSALNLIFDLLAIIPLYVLWAFWYRRRDTYLEAIGGRHEKV